MFTATWLSGIVSTALTYTRNSGNLSVTVGSELLKTCGTAQIELDTKDIMGDTGWIPWGMAPFTIDCASAASVHQATRAVTTRTATTQVVTLGTYSKIDFPGSTQTIANDVNNAGLIVGRYDDAVGFHGFLLDHGAFTTLDFPGADNTTCIGINDAGKIVGGFVRAGVVHGFEYSNGSYTQLDMPGADYTQLHGINLAGQLVGRIFSIDNPAAGGGNGLQKEHGLLYSRGAYTQLDYPGSRTTDAWRITADGTIVGDWSPNGSVGNGSLRSGAVHGYIRQGGSYLNLDFPDSRLTSPRGINAQGQVAGLYWDSRLGEHAFVTYAGQFVGFDYPGATLTDASAINDSGTIVGVYQDAQGAVHGFSVTSTAN